MFVLEAARPLKAEQGRLKQSPVFILGAHRLSNVMGVEWLSDNQLVTTASDCSVKIWDIVHV